MEFKKTGARAISGSRGRVSWIFNDSPGKNRASADWWADDEALIGSLVNTGRKKTLRAVFLPRETTTGNALSSPASILTRSYTCQTNSPGPASFAEKLTAAKRLRLRVTLLASFFRLLAFACLRRRRVDSLSRYYRGVTWSVQSVFSKDIAEVNLLRKYRKWFFIEYLAGIIANFLS